MGIPDTSPVSWETCMQAKKQQLKPDIEGTGSKLGKEYVKAIHCHSAYLTYMQSTTWENAGLDEAQAGTKIAGKSINNFIYADDTTAMAESEEDLKNLLMKVKEESRKAGLKLNLQNPKIVASDPITSWQIEGGEMETVTDFIFLGSKTTVDSGCSHEIKRHLLLGSKVMTNLDSVLKTDTLLCRQRSI